MSNFDVLLLDIEGTITSISFVKVLIFIRLTNKFISCLCLQDTLFPYVRAELSAHLKENWNSDELQEDIKSLADLVNPI